MGANIGVSDLKRMLLDEVRGFFRHNGSLWKKPILDVLNEFRKSNVQAVVFGGTLRSLLVSRIFEGKLGRPRDVDVVVAGVSVAALEGQFNDIIARRNRFGGLQLKQGSWTFDVWPLRDTWAFRQDGNDAASFADLPSTTVFNIEAIAVEAWPKGGRPRTIFSGDDQFFEGILSRTIELNRPNTAFPELTVVRAIVMAAELGFRIGPQLSDYIAEVGPTQSEEALGKIQSSHYGHVRMESTRLRQLIEFISGRSSQSTGVDLPPMGQLRLWESGHKQALPRMKVHCLNSAPLDGSSIQ
jgi:hypothetical protein